MKALLRCDGLHVRKQRKISDLRWLALLTIWCIWFLKFSLELINTPKSLTVSTCAIILVPSEKGEVILCEPIVIMLHLEYDMLNCQSEDHCSIMSSWFWRFECSVLDCYIQIHSVAFDYIRIHSLTFNYIQLHSITFNYIQLHAITFYYIQLHSNTFNYITLNSITLHYIISLHYIALHCITLHYITLHYITSHYITLHHTTSHYITLHHITSHYIT